MIEGMADELLKKREDRVLWLTTVKPSGKPAPHPVWFAYVDGVFVVFSQARAAKVQHVRANSNVTVHFHTDPAAQHVLVVVGTAGLTEESVPPSAVPAYLEKYGALLPGLGYDLAGYDATFDACIKVTPHRAWGF